MLKGHAKAERKNSMMITSWVRYLTVDVAYDGAGLRAINFPVQHCITIADAEYDIRRMLEV